MKKNNPMPIPAYSDIFIRYLLGDEDSVDLLLSFINAVNEDEELPLIKEVEIKNPFNLKTFTKDKESIIDVKAVDEEGRIYDIEVQVTGSSSFVNRSLYYWARLYAGQLPEGKHFRSLKPVVCINLLNFELARSVDCHSCFLLREKRQPDLVLTDDLVMHFIELPKFLKEREFTTHLDQWLAFFKYEGKEEEIMTILLKDNPVLQKAHKKYTRFTQDEEMLELYESRRIWQLDRATELEDVREEGKQEEKLEVARNMKNKGYPHEEISEMTGLSLEKIETL